jgi:hypothetical protein
MKALMIDNPFAIGDLVHVAQGTTLYKILDLNKPMIYEKPMPIKITDIPSIGYIINKSIYDFYLVGIGSREYMIKSEELEYYNKDTSNVYETNRNV